MSAKGLNVKAPHLSPPKSLAMLRTAPWWVPIVHAMKGGVDQGDLVPGDHRDGLAGGFPALSYVHSIPLLILLPISSLDPQLGDD